MTEPTPQHPSQSPNDWSRYDIPLDPDERSARAGAVRLVGSDKRVLELGCSTGRVSEAMQARGCRIIGIEIDPRMAERASAYCERVVVGDVEQIDLAAELGDEHFDVIVATDVLEHLKDPLAVLRRTQPYLSEDGYYVVSLPNIAHGSVRLALLSGQFRYTPMGLLDRTHLRFFTRDSMIQLFEEAGLAIRHLERVEFPIDAVEVQFDKAAVPAAVLENLNCDPEAVTYQFLLVASPMLPFERDLVVQQHQALARAEQPAQGVWDELRLGVEHLQAELARRDQMIAEQEQSAALLQGEIAARDRIIAERHQGILFLQGELDGRDQQLAAVQATVAALEQQVAQQIAGIDWLRQEVALRDVKLEAIYRSRMWRAMNLFWRLRQGLLRLGAVIRR
jgi:2-polyprenyl-3-methyl-5-hydroxy-6-metoxy-1,4-benzoquinol methylase